HTLRRAVELGVTFFDTSDMYGPYTNEELVGRALAPNRSELQIATKFGLALDPDNPDGRRIGGSPAYVREACEGSLRELGVGFVAYSPLGRGFLTGAIRSIDDFAADDYRRSTPRFQGDNFQRNLELVDRVNELATGKGCTPAQLALAWVLAQGTDVVPI